MVKTSEGAGGTQKALVTRVRSAIKDAGINHSEVARQVGLDASKLSKSLAGTRKFRVEEITRIAELTNVTTDWFTTGRTTRQPRRHMVSESRSAALEEAAEALSSASASDDSGGAESPAVDATWMSKGTRNRMRIISAAWELYADLAGVSEFLG